MILKIKSFQFLVRGLWVFVFFLIEFLLSLWNLAFFLDFKIFYFLKVSQVLDVKCGESTCYRVTLLGGQRTGLGAGWPVTQGQLARAAEQEPPPALIGLGLESKTEVSVGSGR